MALWSLQLPANIRARISGKEFNHETYKDVFEAADQAYLSGRQVQVAAVAQPLDETLPAFTAQNQPSQGAAFGKPPKKNPNNGGNGSGGGGKKNKGQGNKNQRSMGQKHCLVPDSQADKMCDRHFRHGDLAWYCVAPQSCPWKDKITPKQ